MADLQGFWERLSRGPAVLLLGQGYLRVETGVDPLLVQIREKFGGPPSAGHNYDVLLEGTASQSNSSALPWIAERCRRMSVPQWLQVVAEYQWSSVYSSAIDPLWKSAFRNDWREVAPIYDEQYYPRDPRSRRSLHCTFLFGCVDQTEPRERPPLSQMELLKRKPIAVNLMRRLPDIVTPLGTLAIEAYLGEQDWLSLEDLYPVLQSMGPAQAHMFSVSEDLARHDIIIELVRVGKLVLHTQGLAWVLQHGSEQGFLQLGTPAEWEHAERTLTLRSGPIPITRDLWNRVTDSATLLDDHALLPPPPMSDDARHWEFRRFLLESGTRPLWSGYASGFAFPRHFEQRLLELTLKSLEQADITSQPLIVGGQTGTGKTVALGRLAYEIARSQRFPVLFIERKTQRPVQADVDVCCKWLEDHGARASLIVWDGMLNRNEYYELQGFLASRGRKVVIVASTYRLENRGRNYISVPDRLTSQEAEDFAEFLKSQGVAINESLRDGLERRDAAYLVALYRLLPPARPRIRTGLIQELEQAEQVIENAIAALRSTEARLTTMARALIKSGIIDQGQAEQTRAAGAKPRVRVADVEDLIHLVMTPGRFGINIPLELLVRTWGRSEFSDIGYILKTIDLFTCFEDSVGRILVGPRHQLEARLISQARLGSVQAEASMIARLIKEVRPKAVGLDDDDDITFAVELLREIGPQGLEQTRYRPFYRALAAALKELRDSRNIHSPRLMLQEAHLLREWVSLTSQVEQRPDEASDILADVESVLHEAMEMLDETRRNQNMRNAVAGELAATAGTQIKDLTNIGAPEHEIAKAMDRVRKAVHIGRSIDFTNYYPIDILVWATFATIKHIAVDDPQRVEALADVLHQMQTMDVELMDSSSVDLFHRRRMELAKLLGQQHISDSAFEALCAIGSTTGYFMRALDIGGRPRDVAGHIDERSASRCQEAWRYLEDNRSRLGHDPRCMNLLFDYWWLSKTREPLFCKERRVLPFGEEEWVYCLRLITELRSSQGSYRSLTCGLIQAVALFHLEQVPQALTVCREVETESFLLRNRRRIIRFFVAGFSDRTPRLYHGTVRAVDADQRRGEVFVDELGRRITFLSSDFNRPNVRPGESLGEFHIAFNFLGPIADPASRYDA